MMGKPTVVIPAKDSTLIYQAFTESGPGEPAILVNEYSDIISIDSESQSVNVNFETIPALTKVLNNIYREWKSAQ